MQIKHLGILTALAAVAAAAPHGGQQKALSATNSNTELCFLACLDEAPECPHNFHSKKDGLCWTCCRDGEAGSSVGSAHSFEAYPICWRIILPEKPECPEGMEPLKEGQFWTCCIKDSDISISNKVAKSISKTIDGDGGMPICWRVLFPEKPQCPEGMEPQNFGTEFWTCCVKDSEQTSLSTFKSVDDPFYGECQKTPCPQMPLNCPEGTEYKRLYGFCGTCCPIGSEEPKHSVVKNIGSSDEFCYIVSSPALCADNSRVTPHGPLWKCCVDVEARFKAATKGTVSSNEEQCVPWPLPIGSCPGRQVHHDDGSQDCCFQTSIEAPAKVTIKNIDASHGEQCVSWPSAIFPPCPGDLHENDDGSLTCCFPTATEVLAKVTTKIVSLHAESCIPLPVFFPCPGGFRRVSSDQCCSDNGVAETSPRDQCLGLCFQDRFAGQAACRTLTPFSQPHWTGECYDCCLLGGSMKQSSTKNTDSSHYESCFPWPLPCPAGTHRANNDGLTCCSDESTQREGLLLMNNQICIPALYDKKPTCPEGWAAKEIRPDGGLWVCCVGEQDEARLTKATPKTNVVKSIAGKDDDCLGLCFRNPYEGAQACRNLVPFVRPTWRGECFDCCAGTGSVAYEKVTKSVAKSVESVPHMVQMDHERCLPAIFPEEPICPPGLHPKKISEEDGLWTCCFNDEEGTTKATLKHASIASEVCLHFCFPPNAECPPNFYPGDRSGDGCRFCCTKVGEEAGQIIAEL